MTDVLQLDLSADGEGLLVPFGKALEQPDAAREDPNPVFAPPPVQKKRRGLFFRRHHREHNTEQQEKPNDESPSEKVIEKKQAMTFSFRNAPREIAEDSSKDDKLEESKEEEEEESKEEEEEESKDEDSDDEESEDSDVNEQENLAPNRQTDAKALNDNEPSQDSIKHLPKLEGYGNSQPEEDNPVSAMGRFFKRISRRSDMKAMKVATEDTKDEMTLGETVTHCFQVAIAPEIYADDIEGEDNLGFYRPIRPNPTPLSGQEQALQSMVKWKRHALQLQARVRTLKSEIQNLEEKLKNKDLEAMSWKQRAKELEEQFKNHQDEDDPWKKYENKDFDEEAGSEIDHEWHKRHPSRTQEKTDTKNAVPSEKQQTAPATKPVGGQSESEAEGLAGVKEAELLETDATPKEMKLDPLLNKSGRPMSDTNVNAEDEPAQEEITSVQETNRPKEVKEEILIDTDIETKIEFDPIAEKAKETSTQPTEDVDESDDLVNLIASLAQDVETQKDEVAASSELHDLVSPSSPPRDMRE